MYCAIPIPSARSLAFRCSGATTSSASSSFTNSKSSHSPPSKSNWSRPSPTKPSSPSRMFDCSTRRERRWNSRRRRARFYVSSASHPVTFSRFVASFGLAPTRCLGRACPYLEPQCLGSRRGGLRAPRNLRAGREPRPFPRPLRLTDHRCPRPLRQAPTGSPAPASPTSPTPFGWEQTGVPAIHR
jgi:hypothetical protein